MEVECRNVIVAPDSDPYLMGKKYWSLYDIIKLLIFLETLQYDVH